MNRNLKFRAWNKPVNTWWKTVHGLFFSLHDKGLLEKESISISSLASLGEDFATLQKFTGLLDKNNKEIYEGDIIKLHNNSQYTKEEYWFPIYRIHYSNWGGGLNYIGGGKGVDNILFLLLNYSQQNIEVIGNIFENPELLKT